MNHTRPTYLINLLYGMHTVVQAKLDIFFLAFLLAKMKIMESRFAPSKLLYIRGNMDTNVFNLSSLKKHATRL